MLDSGTILLLAFLDEYETYEREVSTHEYIGYRLSASHISEKTCFPFILWVVWGVDSHQRLSDYEPVLFSLEFIIT